MTSTAVPYVTAGLAGIGGRLRVTHEDFHVEEVPLYLPCGEGEHLYVVVEKRGIATLPLIDRLARALSISPQRIGYAGLKDARAVTVQTLSIQGGVAEDVARLELQGVRFLSMARHRNKLRRGHLAGNRFAIGVREAGPDAVGRATAILAMLAERGVPNFFGPQRFGNQGNTDALGRAVLARDGQAFLVELLAGHPAAQDRVRAGDLAAAQAALPEQCRHELRIVAAASRAGAADAAFRAIPRPLLRLYLSALQSALFNEILRRRMSDLQTVQVGDLAWLHDRGAVFLVQQEELSDSVERAARFAISASGPLFGARCALPAGEPLRIEEDVLAAAGLTRAGFDACDDLRGARRPLRVPVADPRVVADGERLVVSFGLPPGSYATVVMEEILKSDVSVLDAGVRQE